MRMRGLIGIGIVILWTATSWGQVYHWTDENGVRHFSDTPPAESYEDVQSREALPYDRQADEERMREDERRLKEYRDKRGAEEKEAELRRAQQKEAEELMAEENRREAERLIAAERDKLDEKLFVLEQRLQRLLDYRHLYYQTSGIDYEGAIRRIRRQIRREKLKTEEAIQQIKEKYGLPP